MGKTTEFEIPLEMVERKIGKKIYWPPKKKSHLRRKSPSIFFLPPQRNLLMGGDKYPFPQFWPQEKLGIKN